MSPSSSYNMNLLTDGGNRKYLFTDFILNFTMALRSISSGSRSSHCQLLGTLNLVGLSKIESRHSYDGYLPLEACISKNFMVECHLDSVGYGIDRHEEKVWATFEFIEVDHV